MPGPVPKRSDQRRRRNKPAGGEVTKISTDTPVKAPRVSPSWHPLMKDWFRSLKESGQAVFYEPSDWQQARLLAELMSQELKRDKPIRANILAEFHAASMMLMTTEGARRKLRLELQREQYGSTDTDDGVLSVMSEYKKLLS